MNDNKFNLPESRGNQPKPSVDNNVKIKTLPSGNSSQHGFFFRQPISEARYVVGDAVNRIINVDFQKNLPVNSVIKSISPEVNETTYAEIIFKSKRKKIFRNEYHIPLEVSDYVVVEVENGVDLGTVLTLGDSARERIRNLCKNGLPEYTIIRLANEDDLARYRYNCEEEEIIIEKAREAIKRYELDMKVTEAEWQYDRQRLTISFTAPQRIDFREPVKELARTFKTRIELRQISTREEAKQIGGLGSCGRSICCSSFSADTSHVTLEHARTQQLSNNVAKLSGYCGRLKCCLLFEYPNYVEAFKKYPPLNSLVDFPDGIARINKVDIFKDIIYLQYQGGGFKTITFSELEMLYKEGKVIIQMQEDNYKVSCKYSDSDDVSLLEDLY